MSKNLKEKAISIKGKAYVLVSDRVIYFNEQYTNGSIVTEKSESGERVEFKAKVTPDVDKPARIFTGHSQAVWGDGYINKTSALENAETSAVGRALALMGIGVIDSIASVDEINKAQMYPTTKSKETSNVDSFMQNIQPTDEEVISWQEKLESAQNLTELKKFWTITPPMVQDKLSKVKEDLKAKFIKTI
jgi:hypothetical protein